MRFNTRNDQAQAPNHDFLANVPRNGLVGLGHSHIVALAKGFYSLQREGASFRGAPLTGSFHYLHDEHFVPLVQSDGGTAKLNSVVPALFAAAAPIGVVLSIGGNAHNILSIRRLQTAYDVVLPENPELPLDPTADVLPVAVISGILEDWLAEDLVLLRLLRASTTLPMVVAEPPPPMPGEHIARFPAEFFGEDFEPSQIAGDLFRHKVWRLQCRLLRRACERLDLPYLPVPAWALDDNGVAAASVVGGDATHAGDVFGREMILSAMHLLFGEEVTRPGR